MLKIGSHVNYTSQEGLLGCVKETLENQGTTFMFYTGAPQNTKRSAIDLEKLEAAKKLLEANDMKLSDIIVHAPYIINLANRKEEDKWQFSISFLEEEVRRVNTFGLSYLVLHPGSHVGEGSLVGIKNIIDALNLVFERTKDIPVMILLETMAGKGTEIGKTLEELEEIIKGVKDQQRIGICLDTCHLNDAGYDIKDFDSFLEQFEQKFPLSLIHCVHINDSKNEKGSHKDRHENFGFGTIGFDTLIHIVYHKKLEQVPKILETPYINHTYSPYKKEIQMIREQVFDKNLFQEEKATI